MRKNRLVFGMMLLFSISSFGQIEGDVVDQKEKGISNAIITAIDSTGKVIDTVKTDKRGFYFFKTLKTGKYNIEVKAFGFLPAIYKNIEVEKVSNLQDEYDDTYYAVRLNITLTPAKVPK